MVQYIIGYMFRGGARGGRNVSHASDTRTWLRIISTFTALSCTRPAWCLWLERWFINEKRWYKTDESDRKNFSPEFQFSSGSRTIRRGECFTRVFHEAQFRSLGFCAQEYFLDVETRNTKPDAGIKLNAVETLESFVSSTPVPLYIRSMFSSFLW